MVKDQLITFKEEMSNTREVSGHVNINYSRITRIVYPYFPESNEGTLTQHKPHNSTPEEDKICNICVALKSSSLTKISFENSRV